MISLAQTVCPRCGQRIWQSDWERHRRPCVMFGQRVLLDLYDAYRSFGRLLACGRPCVVRRYALRWLAEAAPPRRQTRLLALLDIVEVNAAPA